MLREQAPSCVPALNQGCMSLSTYHLEDGHHLARLCRRRRCRAYAPATNTASHDNHEKIRPWERGWGCRSSAIIISLVFSLFVKYSFQVSFNSMVILSMVKITQNTVTVLLQVCYNNRQFCQFGLHWNNKKLTGNIVDFIGNKRNCSEVLCKQVNSRT